MKDESWLTKDSAWLSHLVPPLTQGVNPHIQPSPLEQEPALQGSPFLQGVPEPDPLCSARPWVSPAFPVCPLQGSSRLNDPGSVHSHRTPSSPLPLCPTSAAVPVATSLLRCSVGTRQDLGVVCAGAARGHPLLGSGAALSATGGDSEGAPCCWVILRSLHPRPGTLL